MEKMTSGGELERISALIRAEEEAALAAFRDRDFPGAVLKKWRESRPGAAPRPNFRRAAVWASTAALLIVVATAVWLVRRPPAAEGRPGFEALASILGGLPGGITLGREEPARPDGAGPAGMTGLAGSVRSGLATAGRSERRREERASPRLGPVPPARLSLDRKMEILFKDRVIERTFLMLKNPSKEV